MALQKHTKIFTAFSFWWMRSPDICWYQWIYPTVLFVVIVLAYWSLDGQYLTFRKMELIEDINSLMGILTGFYIAALAAVSSFPNENLDQVMKGRSPILARTREGKSVPETLTRRRFLSVLFGYCAAMSVVLYIVGVLLAYVTISESAADWPQQILAWGHRFVLLVYVWLMSSLLVATLLGLHYLVDRMHRE